MASEPAPTKSKTIVLFGETGAGKSSVINLIANREVAHTSPGLEGCTMAAQCYPLDLDNGMKIRIYDTVGLEEPEMGVNGFFQAIQKARVLVSELSESGGIDLLLFCIRSGRITAAMQRTYRLFFEFLCEKKVPLALIVTHLENEDVMEGWWKENEDALKKYGISVLHHACITAAPAHLTMFEKKRAQSRDSLQKLLSDALNGSSHPYSRDTRVWFMHVILLLQNFLKHGGTPKRRKLVSELEKKCSLTRVDAERLADEIWPTHK